ncbi:hypothetical protein B0J11DRAFT_535382 [Dendryphion nanum]|uniref:Uncharacterized protein n=1 Tax=Dendryphion nanum TaxID=256645 RepID=A0A9P9DGP4_9PLEO|nr:hypothetical protein B0J11DRAFT_535382 [Dendryphion nanum]
MAIGFILSLLAALFTISVIAGPVPQYHKRLYILPQNTSALSGIPSRRPQTSTGSPTLLTTSVPVAESLIVTPIERSVFSTIKNAETFFDPNGKPFITFPAETLLSTLYIPKPPAATPSEAAPTSAAAKISESVSGVTQTPSAAQSTLLTVSSSRSNPAILFPSGSSSALETQSSRQFTYSPETEGVTPASSSVQAQSSSRVTSITPSGTVVTSQNSTLSTALGGFQQPGAGASSIAASSGSSSSVAVTGLSSTLIASVKPTNAANSTIVQSTRAIQQSSVPVVPSSSNATPSFIIFTKTEYTTVTPTPSQVSQSQAPRPQSSSSGTGALSSLQSQASPSAAPSSPATELSAPPVVIITLYTTVTPTPRSISSTSIISTPPSIPSSAPATPPLVSTPIATPSTSILASQIPVPTPSSSQPISSQIIQTSTPVAAIPTSTTQPAAPPSAAPPAPPQSSVVAPVPTPPAPVPTSQPALIVTPIPVVTVTQTVTEKETVTVTVKG